MHSMIFINNVLNVNEFLIINIISNAIMKIIYSINTILKSIINYIIDFSFELLVLND